jgi:hypothetical protein
MARRLRITVSVFFTVLAMLLCMLWVRSYWIADWVELSCCNSIGLLAVSRPGDILASLSDIAYAWTWRTAQVPENWSAPDSPFPVCELSFDEFTIRCRHWFPVLVCSIIAAAPWVPRSFSLRTMLIATTLLAVLLGLLTWLTS